MDVAQRLRSFPPGRLFFGPGETGPGMGWYPDDVRVSAPGAAEYQALLQSNRAVPILRALLKDSDPKIRTLAAAALVAKGEPRLQQHLGPLLDDQSPTFDVMWRPQVDNFVPTRFTPETVATAVLSLVEFSSKSDFDQYRAIHANREYCADWFIWQLRHQQFAPLARQDLQKVPSPDREVITLWIGTGAQFQYSGFTDGEMVAAAKNLAADRALDVLRGQPPGTDPDIKRSSQSHTTSVYLSNEHYKLMSKFLLRHAPEVLRPSDAETLLSLEAEEKRRATFDGTELGALWLIAAAGLRPERSDQILDEAERRYHGVVDIPLARWAIQGRGSLPKVERWFDGPEDSQERLAVGILVAEPNRQYEPLVAAILGGPNRLRIDREAMYRFAEFAQKSKLDFDRQFVDWIYAQSPDPIPRSDYKSRQGVIEKSGVARRLVRDPRFTRADARLLCEIKESLAHGTSKLSRPQSLRLERLVQDIYLKPVQDIPKSKLEEIRVLLRREVGQ